MGIVIRRVVLITGCMVVGVSAAILSAHSTHAEILRQHVLTSSGLAWLFVALFEGGALVMAVLADERVGEGESATWYRTVLGVLLGAAVMINVQQAWAGGSRGSGLAISGMPPVILIVVLDAVWREQVRKRRGRSTDLPSKEPVLAPGHEHRADRDLSTSTSTTEITNDQVITGGDRGQITADRPLADRDQGVSAHDERHVITSGRTQLHSVPASEEREPVPAGPERDAMVDRLLAENPDIKGSQVAERLGLAKPSGRRELGRAKERARRRSA